MFKTKVENSNKFPANIFMFESLKDACSMTDRIS